MKCAFCGCIFIDVPSDNFCPRCRQSVWTRSPPADNTKPESRATERTAAQDVICCDLCPGKKNKNPVEFACKKCQLNLCKACVGLHVSSDPSILHDITGYKFKEDKRQIKLAGCKVHQNKKCELHCKNCKTSICSKCVVSNNHSNHEFEEISDICDALKSCLRRENQEYERYIIPTYDKIISDLQSSLDIQKKNYEKMREEIKKQGQHLHSEVAISIQKLLANANEMEKEDMAALSSSLSEMQNRRSGIQLAVKENQELEKANDAANLMEYSSKMDELKRVPSMTELSTPSFRPREIKSDVLVNMCGFLIPSTKTKRKGYFIQIP